MYFGIYIQSIRVKRFSFSFLLFFAYAYFFFCLCIIAVQSSKSFIRSPDLQLLFPFNLKLPPEYCSIKT